MTPLERLLTEELPTGTFGGPYTAPHPPRTFTTAADEQARHAADLAAALGTWVYGEAQRPHHLRAVPTTQLPAATTDTSRSAA